MSICAAVTSRSHSRVHVTDHQAQEASLPEEVQKRSFLEVYVGPHPPGGRRHPGLGQLCTCLKQAPEKAQH